MATITTNFNDFGQDIVNNKSNLTITIYISADNNQTYFYNKTLTCTCNGISQSASISMSKGRSVTQSFTWYDIYHNADGSKSVDWNWSVVTNTSVLGTITRSGTQVLQTIPRASSISLSPTSIVLGNSTTITISRASENFTHTLLYQIGNQTGTIVTKTSSLTATFTSTKEMAEQFPNSKNGSCIITCITYSGDTQLGTKTATLTLQTENTSEYQPIMDAMTLTFENKFHDKILNGITSATLTAGTTHTKYGASVSSYILTIGSVTSRNSILTLNPINRTMAANVETIQATGQVTDSRGYSGNATLINFDLYKYNAPSVTNYSLERCLQNGTPDTNGTYAKLYIKYTYANYGYNNSISVKKININDTDYTISANEQTADGITTGEGTTIIGDGNLSNVQSYNYTITITDAVGTSVIIENSLPNGAKILNFKDGGLGIAIGKPSTEDYLVDSEWDIKAPNINAINSGLTSILSTALGATTGTTTQVKLLETTIPDEGVYFFNALVPMNYYGQEGRNLNCRLLVNDVQKAINGGVINTQAYTLYSPLSAIVEVPANATIKVTIQDSLGKTFACPQFNLQYIRLK